MRPPALLEGVRCHAARSRNLLLALVIALAGCVDSAPVTEPRGPAFLQVATGPVVNSLADPGMARAMTPSAHCAKRSPTLTQGRQSRLR